MKRIILTAISLLFFFMFTSNVDAKAYYAKVVDITGYADLHSSPSGSSSWSETFYADDVLILLDTNKYSSNWYKVQSPKTGAVGYVSANYVVPYIDYETGTNTPTQACEIELYNAGFKDASYWPYLCYLKEQHPNWNFVPEMVNADFAYSVSRESSCGKSYVYSSNTLLHDSTCNNQYDDGKWFPASATAVAYYMDPRNFLAENFIFQFEYLKYDEKLINNYTGVVTTIIDHSEFYKYHLNSNIAQIIHNAGKDTNVSPSFIAARMLQELGSGTSLYNLYSGIYPGFEGYYNFYNWGVSDSCATTSGPTYCGLQTAQTNGWNSLHAAIAGGAAKIADLYINVGQDTLYLQKYNVAPTDSSQMYVHQYMTNIEAPFSEAKTTYASYRDSGLLTSDSAYTFYIPVYSNMDGDIATEGNGATGEDGNVDPSILAVSTIVTSSGLKYSTTSITGFEVGVSIADTQSKLEAIAGKGNVKITNKDGSVITDGIIKTGDKITITTESGVETVPVVIHGDTSGDGKINALDLLQVQQNILGIYDLNNEYGMAGDTSGDGKINALDLLQVQQNILGIYKIEQ